MTPEYVFLFACAVFACDLRTMPGDGAHYDSKDTCTQAARSYALRRRIRLNRWEIVCVPRERAQ